jgi:hypothetical protein
MELIGCFIAGVVVTGIVAAIFCDPVDRCPHCGARI